MLKAARAEQAALNKEISLRVKNLKDGSVEVLAIGDRKILEKLLEEIEKKPGHGSISSIKKNFTKKELTLENFEIRY